MAGIFNNLAQYNSYRDTMTGRLPMARHGASWDGGGSHTKSRSWELIKEFKGKSHKDGGIDIEVGDGYVKQLNGKGIQPDDIAKNGRIWKDIGAAAYGAGEGLLDTLTFGATDQLTDAGYNALQKVGGSSDQEKREQNSIRGYGTAAGAITGGVLSGGATTGSAIQQGAKGVGAGVSQGSPDSKLAQQVGNWLPLAGNIAGMAMGNAGFKDATGAAASLGKFSTAAQKYSSLMPFAAQGLGMMGGGNNQAAVPEMGQQLSLPSNINSVMQSMQMLNLLRNGMSGMAGKSRQTTQAASNMPASNYSQQPMEGVMMQQQPLNPPSKFKFVNDLSIYGINK